MVTYRSLIEALLDLIGKCQNFPSPQKIILLVQMEMLNFLKSRTIYIIKFDLSVELLQME